MRRNALEGDNKRNNFIIKGGEKMKNKRNGFHFNRTSCSGSNNRYFSSDVATCTFKSKRKSKNGCMYE